MSKSAKLQSIAYALGLLALAYPSPALVALGLLVSALLAVAGWALAHLTATLTVAAGVMLARTFPGRLGRAARWLGRAWDMSIDAILPVKAPAKA